LIGAVSVLLALGVPMLVYDLAGRAGRKRWWFAGSGLLLSALLVAPMPETAGRALAHHGYWPGQAVDEVGMSQNNAVQRATWGLGREVGGWLGVTVAADGSYTALGAAPAAEASSSESTSTESSSAENSGDSASDEAAEGGANEDDGAGSDENAKTDETTNGAAEGAKQGFESNSPAGN
jgi:hypothetical protein